MAFLTVMAAVMQDRSHARLVFCAAVKRCSLTESDFVAPSQPALLMTIMFAGGMTIAIPGELPTAVAQTNTLSVSAAAAGVFGGAQVIEIVIDDPDVDEVGQTRTEGIPDVEVDGEEVTMRQAATGKWYAYVADRAAFVASPLTTDDSSPHEIVAGFLSGAPTPFADGAWTVQTFDFDGDVEITANRGDESIILDYDDHSDIATISVDRNDVPAGGQVHITISDFQLNLDPTASDIWTLNATNSTEATYNTAADATDADDNPLSIAFDEGSTSVVFTTGGQDEDVIVDEKGNASDGIVTIDETGSNTGMFESSDGDGNSEIRVSDGAASGDTFTVGYADNDQQVIVNDFSSTLELIADGTWDSGESLTIRLSSENLDLNTLDDESMAIGDDHLAVLMLGDPITLENVKSATIAELKFGEAMDINAETHVLTLTTAGSTTLAIELTDSQLAQLEDTNSKHYINYLSDLEATTDADIELPTGADADAIPVNNGDQITLTDDADGAFTVTFTTDDADVTAAADANTAIQDAVRNATKAAAADDATATTVQEATTDGITDAPSAFTTAISDAATAENATAADVLAATKTSAAANIVTVKETVVADIFTFGAHANHAIYRALLEETGDGTAVFEGTVEYQILNQKTVDSTTTHTGITTIDDELAIILNEGLTGTDGPTVTYDGDHVREDAPAYTGEISFDAATYNVADEVTVILVDPDLNIDADGIDIYTVDATVDDETELLSLTIADDCTIPEFENLSMRETTDDSGTFEGTFEVPEECTGIGSTTGKDISTTYYDFRDSSGSPNEWGDSATIGADTGSVSLDRTVYPVPAASDDDERGIKDTPVTVYVSIDDADFDESSGSINSIMEDEPVVTISIDGIDIATLGDTGNPIDETSADSGVFEDSVDITASMEGVGEDDGKTAIVEQGSIITVKYDDPTDASGKENSVSDSATFDLRNAVLTSDKSTYVIGQDAFLTLIEPDLNLDSASQETIDLDRIAWDSNAEGDTDLSNGAFGAVPANLRESGANTGIFHVSITIPEDIGGSNLERGEAITLTYTDWGPSGADSVGDDDREVELSIKTSNFGATLELDQNIYTWTDKVFITIVASDYNFDSNVIDEIGDAGDGEITVRIRSNDIEEYNLVETGPDTGVFTGELTLVGTELEAGDNINVQARITDGDGPTDGIITADNGDGLSVSFEYSDSESPLVASALIRWNVGEVQWLEASYSATGSGIVRGDRSRHEPQPRRGRQPRHDRPLGDIPGRHYPHGDRDARGVRNL